MATPITNTGDPQIETPTQTNPTEAPALFVMPEEYRHGATGKKLVEPVKEVLKPAIPIAKPLPATRCPRRCVPKKRSKKRLVLTLSLALLVPLLIGAYAVYSFINPTPEPLISPVVTTRPNPTTTPEPKPVETPKPSEAPTNPFPNAKTSGIDSDSDGLTDLEESLIYNTNSKLPDTDSDGFLDGNEVFHRYNPFAKSPGTLLESGLVKAMVAPTYSLLYPAVWSLKETMFIATTGEKISITIKPISDGWNAFLKANGYTNAFELTNTKQGYVSHQQEDGLLVVIETGTGEAVIFNYDAGIKGSVDYLQTFKMMVNSFKWLSSN